MRNPFKYTHTVTDQAFCNRVKEQDQLYRFIQNSQNVLIYAPRRTGKSSLIKQVLKNIEDREAGIGIVYADIYGTTSESEFVNRVLKEVGGLKSSIEKMMAFLTKNFKSIPFKVGMDPNTFSLTLTYDAPAGDKDGQLETLMVLLEKLSKDRNLVVVFDEFQAIAGYSEGNLFEKKLRSFIQQHDNICYIFAGSQKHLLTTMFQSQDRAFYQQATSFPLSDINKKEYMPWLTEKFSVCRNPVPRAALEEILRRMEYHPMLIQFFCYFLWEEMQVRAYDEDLLDAIEKQIIENKKFEYQAIWDSLSPNQKKVLKLVLKNDGKNLFSAKSLVDMELKTGSVVRQCLNSLCDKDLLEKIGKGYIITDLFLRKWLATQS